MIHISYQIGFVLKICVWFTSSFKKKIEIEPPFESRDVQIRRGLNVRDFFEMEEEIGRYRNFLFYYLHLCLLLSNCWLLLLVCTEVNSELCSSVERRKLVSALRPNSSKRPKRPTGSTWNARSRSWNRCVIPDSYNFTTPLTTARKRFVFCLNCKSSPFFPFQ